jgi:hypothetical protein
MSRSHCHHLEHYMTLDRVILAVAAAGALGCDSSSAAQRSGSARMVDTLAQIYAQAVADPRTNAFLNRERAAALRVALAQQVGLGELNSRFLLAQEQLLAGDTRGGIDGLDSLRQLASFKVDSKAPRNKPFFDLLAIAYLRLGEQENCALNMSASICILPLDGAARHVREEGARRAIALYEQILRAFPDDRGSRWLLNISYMAVGGYPARVPRQWLIPGIAAVRDKTFPRFYNVASAVGLAVNNLAGGLSVEDFNRDGLLDLFMTSWGLRDPVHLFIADGKGGYVDRTNEAGLTGITGGLNTIHADYDNDGFEDILILRGAWLGDAGEHPCSLLHNRGDGTFEDVTFAAGLGSLHPRHSAAWADFNLDGQLDLVVGNESGVANGKKSHPSELFVNKGNGTFSEVSRSVGIDLDAFVKGVVWSDVNNDGLPDLFASVFGGPNRLYMNRGGKSNSTWRFEETALASGVRMPVMSFPTWFWDFDNDGWEDLLVLSYDIRNSGALHDAVAMEYLGENPPVEHARLYRNKGDGAFEDVSAKTGLAGKVIYAMGSNFGDLDNDGWLDFYLGTGNPDLRSVIPNRMFRSVGGKRFDEVTMEGGFGHLQKGHATAFADFDRDGDEDIYMVMGGAYQGDMFTNVLFENPGWTGRNWITLELEGRTANRSAIGARVELVAADSGGTEHTVYRTVGTGGSFGAGSLQLHVGLGVAVRVKRLRITWPDAARSTTSYANLEPKRAYRIVQGEAPTQLNRPPVPFAQLAKH